MQVTVQLTKAELAQMEVASALATKYGFPAPNDHLLNEYESYAKNVAEGDPMEFDDWLAGSDLPEIVQARNSMTIPTSTRAFGCRHIDGDKGNHDQKF